MRIAIRVDRDEAVLAGSDVFGDVVIEVAAADLSAEDRATLVLVCQIDRRDRTEGGPDFATTCSAHYRRDRATGIAIVNNGYDAGSAYILPPLAEATVETLRRRLAEIRGVPAAIDLRDHKQCAEHVATILADTKIDHWSESRYDKWANRRIVLRRKIPWLSTIGGPYDPWADPRVIEHREAMWVRVDGLIAESTVFVAWTAAWDIERERREDAKKQVVATERASWIGEHGSDRLQRLLAEDIEHDAVYYDERLAADRPGWRWYRDVPGRIDEPRNPPAEALALLDEARRIVPDAELQYYAIEDDETGEMLETGYVAADDYLDRQIVLGAEAVEAAAE